MGTSAQDSTQIPYAKQANQTQFFYGKEEEKRIGMLLQSVAKKVLVLYGREELRNTSWYEQMLDSLQTVQISFVEFGGIDGNTELAQIEEGISVCHRQQVDYILAVGGGSVIDAAKAIAMGAVCDHCVWNYFTTEQKPTAALPVALVLTIPGSGSENNDQTMITNEATLLKMSCRSQVLQPQFCIISPEIFYTIEQPQLAHAVVSMLTRLLCDYLLLLHQDTDAKQIKKMEQKIKTLLHKARVLQLNRFDDNAWLELVLLDAYQSNQDQDGRQEDACLHMAAELSAMYDVPYGAVLAVLLPAWVQFVCSKNPQAYCSFAQNIMGVDVALEPQDQLQEGIRQLEGFLAEMGLSNSLCALGIEDFCFKNVAQICTGYGWGQEQPFGVIQPLYWQDLYQIYQSVYEHTISEEVCSA